MPGRWREPAVLLQQRPSFKVEGGGAAQRPLQSGNARILKIHTKTHVQM
jgi:hypothetical protein